MYLSSITVQQRIAWIGLGCDYPRKDHHQEGRIIEHHQYDLMGLIGNVDLDANGKDQELKKYNQVCYYLSKDWTFGKCISLPYSIFLCLAKIHIYISPTLKCNNT